MPNWRRNEAIEEKTQKTTKVFARGYQNKHCHVCYAFIGNKQLKLNILKHLNSEK